MERPEKTPLEMARRHVQMGEEHIARQVQIIADLRATGQDVEQATAVLATQEEFLRLARQHVAILEAKVAKAAREL